jgi:hypothetical protein
MLEVWRRSEHLTACGYQPNFSEHNQPGLAAHEGLLQKQRNEDCDMVEA